MIAPSPCAVDDEHAAVRRTDEPHVALRGRPTSVSGATTGNAAPLDGGEPVALAGRTRLPARDCEEGRRPWRPQAARRHVGVGTGAVRDVRRLEREHRLRRAPRVDRRAAAARREPRPMRAAPSRAGRRPASARAARCTRAVLPTFDGFAAGDVPVLRRARSRNSPIPATAGGACVSRSTLSGRKLRPVDRVRRCVVDRHLASFQTICTSPAFDCSSRRPRPSRDPEPPGGARHQRRADLARAARRSGTARS